MNRRGDDRKALPARPLWPRPLLSLLLALVWLLLQQSLALPQLAAAALLGWGLPRLLQGWLVWPGEPVAPGGQRRRRSAWRRAGVALGLAGVVAWDILRGNLAVARLVLWPGARPRPAWVSVPLTLTQPGAISLLAAVVTTTPGTVSCLIDERRSRLLVHVLDTADAAALVAEIGRRYEQPIREIFE
jgi:multicomponent K+:H+ antiporter subunit E